MSSIKKIVKRKLTRLISSFYNPLIDLKIGNQKIKIQFSHPLIQVMELYPDYNFNLPRMISRVGAKYKDLKIIDIGANVGDTVAFIRNYSDAPILCIDGDPKYLELLKMNVAQFKDIAICNAIVGKETKEIQGEYKIERGTGFVAEGNKKTAIRTIENILEEFPNFKNSKVVKIDTDGYDTVILKGCSNFLKNVTPVLFFEFDPYLIKNNDDPFSLFAYLKGCGYTYFIFYMNNGDYLLSCTVDDTHLLDELVHFFSGRNIDVFADICAFSSKDKDLFDTCVQQEIVHFKKARNY
jgi:FkbM family methyltransferase